LGMLTAVMGGAFLLINQFQTRYRYEEAYAEAQRNARFAVTRISEIIRSAGTNPTADTTVNPTDFLVFLSPQTVSGSSVSSASIQLKSDLNGDKTNTASVSSNTDVIVTSENVTLRLDAANRQIVLVDNTKSPAVTTAIADSISSLTFTDTVGTRKAVVVRLVAVPNGIQPTDPNYREVIYTATVRLRNR
jgi:hypothetical protein